MLVHNSHTSIAALIKAASMFAVGLAFANPASANIYTVNWDLAAAGVNGVSESFTADAIKATEVSHISFTDASGNWEEHGYAQITGFTLNGQSVSTPGLNNDYTLYIKFDGTGNQLAGVFYTATEILYLVKGQSVFSIDGNNDANVVDQNPRVELASSSLIWGTSGVTQTGDFYADLLGNFSQTVPGVFGGLPGSARFYGNFFHAMAQPGGVVFEYDINDPAHNGPPIGVILNGGDDTLYFVPEPASWLLFAGGLPGLLLGFRRRV